LIGLDYSTRRRFGRRARFCFGVTDSKFKFSYVDWVIKCLEGMNEVVREQKREGTEEGR
jgi:hypothetical protein